MRILVVEDDPQVASSLKACFEAEAFTVDVASDGEQGLRSAKSVDYDLMILDYVLPELDGMELCRMIREHGKKAPILMLTVRAETPDKVAALDIGADDYLTKPFSVDELRARVRALMRRPQGIMDDTLKIDDLALDVQRQRIMRGEKEVYLTRKEFMLLEYLLRNQGIVLSRQKLLAHVWGSDIDSSSNTIEMHVMSLRKKIDAPARRKLIHTVPGRGYTADLR